MYNFNVKARDISQLYKVSELSLFLIIWKKNEIFFLMICPSHASDRYIKSQLNIRVYVNIELFDFLYLKLRYACRIYILSLYCETIVRPVNFSLSSVLASSGFLNFSNLSMCDWFNESNELRLQYTMRLFNIFCKEMLVVDCGEPIRFCIYLS